MRTAPRVGGLALAALLLGPPVLASAHRFANDFVFDDVHVIQEGSVIHDPSQLAALWTHHTMFASAADPGLQSVDTYRPVPLTLFMWDAALSGRAPFSYHLTNLLLHLLCVGLLFAVARRYVEDPRAALYGALLFGLHPWGVEAHVWINGRSDPLCLAFGLAAFLALLRGEGEPSTRRRLPAQAAALGLTVLGLLS